MHLEAQAQRVAPHRAGDVEPDGHLPLVRLVALAAELERVDADVRIDPAPFAGVKSEAPEIEDVGALRHRPLR